MTRLLAVLAVAAGMFLEPALSATKKAAKKPVVKKTSSAAKTNAAKRAAAKRRLAARRAYVPKAPVVSAKIRAASAEFVSGAMDAVAAAAVENSAALVPFFEQLHQLENQGGRSLHVLQYGDSHTASDDWANQLRTLFQGRFGNGGSGFSFAGTPFRGYRRFDVKGGQSPRWETEGLLTRGVDGHYGLGGASIVSDRAGQFVYLDADGEKIEVHYLKQPGGGRFRVMADGQELEVVDTNGPLGPGQWSRGEGSSKPGEGLRRYSVETLDDSPVKLFGWVSEKSKGLTWETLGINGAQANISLRWENEQLREYIEKRNPGLLVLAYGTNEASAPDWDMAGYKAMFRQVVERFRAMAPSASILIVGPPDRAMRVRRTWTSVPKLDMVAEAQRAVAQETGCAFWDLRERMGGDGAMKRWVYAGYAQGDFVHLTGQGYRLVGETLYRDLMAHYEEFRKIRQRVFSEAGSNQDNGQAKENY